MYKKLLLLLILFFCGCGNEKLTENISTIIEENKNIIVGINYPTTGFKKLDNTLKNDIESIYNDFKDNYESFNLLNEKSELNIDYTYDILNDNYITISIRVYINSTNTNDINYIKTYNYSIRDNKILIINDLIDNNKINKVYKYISQYLIKNYKRYIKIEELSSIKLDNFKLDDEYLYIYINPNEIKNEYDDIIEIMIPLKSINLSFKKNIKDLEIAYPVSKYIDINKKVVALTFDDGPGKYTKEIIKILKDNDAVATFFVIGNKVNIYNETLELAIKNGNEIGNHSYNHKWLTKINDDELDDQITKTQNIIYQNLKYTPTSFRPTYGALNQNMKKNINLNIILWNVDTMDWKYKSVDKIVSRATTKTKDLDIILMHDTKKRTVDALKKIIPILKKQGFTFVTIDQLEKIKYLRDEK